MENPKTYVTNLLREKYNNKGKEYFNYFVLITLCGRQFKIGMQPTDIDGYNVLDLIFSVNESVALFHENGEFTDNDGKKVETHKYSVGTVDEETGITVVCYLKAQSTSHKEILKSVALFNAKQQAKK